MSQTETDKSVAAEERTEETMSFVRTVKSAARRRYTPEEKIRIVLEGFRREVTVGDLCRREGIKSHSYYAWTKEFMGGWEGATDPRHGAGRHAAGGSGAEARERRADGSFEIPLPDGPYILGIYVPLDHNFVHCGSVGYVTPQGLSKLRHTATRVEVEGADVIGIEIKAPEGVWDLPIIAGCF